MENKLSKTSKERLATCESDLQNLVTLALKRCPVDFGVAEGHRSIERQQKLFAEGKSKIDGVTRKGKHNEYPSQAVDLYAWVDGKANWSIHHLSVIAGVMYSCADELGIKIRWGLNWDGDGVIKDDQRFQDAPHFELVR